MKSRTLLVALALLSALIVVAVPATAAGCPAMPAGLQKAGDMIAGQHTDVGDIYIWNNATHIFVRYATVGNPWYIAETHLAVEGSLAAIPQTKKGNPIPGLFEFGDEGLWTQDVCYVVPRDGMTGTVYVAAHAFVNSPCLCQAETAWGMFWCPCNLQWMWGFPGANWATYLQYTLT